jgi:hypothetical protein
MLLRANWLHVLEWISLVNDFILYRIEIDFIRMWLCKWNYEKQSQSFMIVFCPRGEKWRLGKHSSVENTIQCQNEQEWRIRPRETVIITQHKIMKTQDHKYIYACNDPQFTIMEQHKQREN